MPQLAAQAGLPKGAAAWMLMANQPVFADDAAGVAADRVGRVVGRIGLWMLAATVASALVTCGLVAVERALAHRRDVAVDESTAAIVKSDVDTAVVAKKPSKTVFFAMALLAVLAFQVHVFIDSAPLYRAHAPATLLPMLTPVFWIGFNVAMLSLVVGSRPAARTTVAPTLPWLIAAQRRRADRAPDRATRIGVSAHGADTRLHMAGNGPTLDGGGFRRARAPLRFMMVPSRPRRHSMTTRFKTLALIAIASTTFAADAAQAQVVVRIGPPPPPRVEVVPAARPGYLWTPGYWNSRDSRHVWVNGTWVRERRGYVYTQPTWVQEGDRWRFRQGAWGHGERDRDGVPNRHDRHPDNPRRP